MSNGIKFTLLIALGTVALGVCGVVLYNVVAHGWRLTGSPLDLGFLKGDSPEPLPETATWDTTFDAGMVHSLDISTDQVDVSVVRSNSTALAVRALLHGRATDTALFSITSTLDVSGLLRIQAGPTRGGLSGGRAELTIEAPAGSGLRLSSGSGSLLLRGLDGTIEASVARGDINASSIAGEVELETRSGDIVAEGISARGMLRASGGRVTSQLTRGTLTVSGSRGVGMRNHIGSLTASAEHGNVEVELIDPDATATITTDAGDIQLHMLPSARASFDITGPHGRIFSTLPLDSVPYRELRQDVSMMGSLRTTMNGGPFPIILRSQRGTIRLSGYQTATTEYDSIGRN